MNIHDITISIALGVSMFYAIKGRFDVATYCMLCAVFLKLL